MDPLTTTTPKKNVNRAHYIRWLHLSLFCIKYLRNWSNRILGKWKKKKHLENFTNCPIQITRDLVISFNQTYVSMNNILKEYWAGGGAKKNKTKNCILLAFYHHQLDKKWAGMGWRGRGSWKYSFEISLDNISFIGKMWLSTKNSIWILSQ